MAKVQLDIETNFDDAEKDFKDLGDVTESESKRIARNLAKIKPDTIDSLIQRNKRLAVAATATRGKTEALALQHRNLSRDMERLIKNGLDPQSEELQKLKAEYISVNAEIEENTKSVEENAKALKDAQRIKANEDLERSTRLVRENTMALEAQAKILRVVQKGLIVGGTALAAFIVWTTKGASEIEDITASFQPLTGSLERATTLVSMLNQTAATTPFQLGTISEAAQQLLPAMNGNLQLTVDRFRMLGDMAGGSAQKLQSITAVYSRALLKNKVEMGDLNILASAGVPIYSNLAESMGISVKEMTKLASQGKITGDDLTAAFQKMTSEGGLFFNGMEIASATLSGKWSTLQDNIKLVSANIGTYFLPVAKKLMDTMLTGAQAVGRFTSDSDKMRKMLKIALPILTGIAAAMTSFLIISKVVIAVKALSAAMTVLNVIMAANPIGIISLAIGALIALVVVLRQNWDRVSHAFVVATSTMNIGMLKLVDFIVSKVFPIYKKLFEIGAKIPGKIGDGFQRAADGMGALEERINVSTAKLREDAKATIEAADAKLKLSLALKATAAEEAKAAAAAKEAAAAKAAADAANAGAIDPVADPVALGERLRIIGDVEKFANAERVAEFQGFLRQRADIEQVDAEDRLQFFQEELARINESKALSNQEKISAEMAVNAEMDALREESAKRGVKAIELVAKAEKDAIKAKKNYVDNMLSSTKTIFSNMQSVAKNAGKESRALAILLKGVALAEIGINTARSISLASATTPFPANILPIAKASAIGISSAAKVISTPIPSAQTGTGESRFIVPDNTTRSDGVGMKVNPGEQVEVTARGEEPSKIMNVSVILNGEVLLESTQEMIDSGDLIITQDNIQTGAA